MSERDLQHEVRLALGRLPWAVLFRNNCGVAEHWNGRNAQRVVYGLAPGSADLVGIVTMLDGTGRFVALELKSSSGRTTPEQRQWLALVNRMGGYGVVVHSVEEALAAVEMARLGDVESDAGALG